MGNTPVTINTGDTKPVVKPDKPAEPVTVTIPPTQPVPAQKPADPRVDVVIETPSR